MLESIHLRKLKWRVRFSMGENPMKLRHSQSNPTAVAQVISGRGLLTGAAAETAAELETLLGSRAPGEHSGGVVGTQRRACKEIALEHVERDVVGIGPDAEFRIVGEIGVRE